MRERIAAWVRRMLVAGAVALPPGAAFTLLAFEVSSQPRFCGSCHVMRPYYESWQHSTHKDVACVECHIPPGVTSTLRKKYEALAMVASYFTGRYSTNPWAEIDDQSCLRSGCHAKRVLLGRELYRGILFDHQPHLTEMRRAKRLRCTSCHSQIVQGSHIAVTASTCFLCHFKGNPLNEGTGRCTLCHAIPEKRITTAGLSFDHGEVKRFGMDCRLCHEGVVRGDGEVPPERCYTCHNEVERLQRYGETEFLHRKHVTDHKVECLNCHIEILHKIPAREEAVATACGSCHSEQAGHSPVRDLYRGIGARGVEPKPAPMYLAGIRCEACHTRARDGHRGADEVSCMSCHGPPYLTLYRSWKAGLGDRLEAVRGELDRALALAQGDSRRAAALADVRANVEFLERARPVHNPGYALAILARAHGDLAGLLAAWGAEVPPGPPWTEAPYRVECLECHFGIEHIAARAFGRDFPHGAHVVRARLRCAACHGGMDQHGTLHIDASACDRCHARIQQPMAAVAGEDCLGCHEADIGPASEVVRFPHAQHVEAGLDCAVCHAGVERKKHVDFARSREARPPMGHELCGSCHAGDVPDAEGTPPEGANCSLCHVDF